MKFKNLILTAVVSIGIASCTSSLKKADISSSANATEEITKMDMATSQAYVSQVDILAPTEFDLSAKKLQKAKKDLADGDDHEKVIDSIAYSKAYLDQANRLAESRRGKATAILDSRQKAIDAGSKVYGPTAQQLDKADRELKSFAEKIEKLTAQDVAVMQKNYLDIELVAVENRQLGRAKGLIESAKKKGAARHAPNALKTAEIDFQAAEGLVKANRSVSSTYSNEVAKADQSAIYLTAILEETQSGRIKEDVARKVVDQNKRLDQLTAQLNEASDRQKELSVANSELSSTISGQSSELNRQNAELRQANKTVSLQQALQDAQKQFSSDEAEVFQQGNNVVIRLKQIQFASGKAELPEAAKPLLDKVRIVSEELGPQQVRIEGHTDAVGSQQMNQALSEERAQTIANYFSENGIERQKMQTVGIGFAKPLATNKTKEGRAQNRRVDVIITPDTSITE